MSLSVCLFAQGSLARVCYNIQIKFYSSTIYCPKRTIMKKQNIGAGMTLFVLIICMNVAILIMRKTNFRQLFFKVVCHNFNSTITKFGTFKGVCENINTNNLPVSAALLNNWVEDNEFDAFLRSMEEENILPCDFQSANFSDSMHLQKFLDFDQPIILNGFTANWTAFKFWGKRRLRSKYGKRYYTQLVGCCI